MNEKIIFTVKEVSEILHSSPNYIYSLIEKGYLPAIKLGSMKGNDLSDINNIKKINIILNNGEMK